MLSPIAARMPSAMEDLPLPGGPYISTDRPRADGGAKLVDQAPGQDQVPHGAFQHVACQLHVADRLALDLAACSLPAAPASGRSIRIADSASSARALPPSVSWKPISELEVACSVPVACIQAQVAQVCRSVPVSAGSAARWPARFPRLSSTFLRNTVLSTMSRIITGVSPVSDSFRNGGGASSFGRGNLHVHLIEPRDVIDWKPAARIRRFRGVDGIWTGAVTGPRQAPSPGRSPAFPPAPRPSEQLALIPRGPIRPSRA